MKEKKPESKQGDYVYFFFSVPKILGDKAKEAVGGLNFLEDVTFEEVQRMLDDGNFHTVYVEGKCPRGKENDLVSKLVEGEIAGIGKENEIGFADEIFGISKETGRITH